MTDDRTWADKTSNEIIVDLHAHHEAARHRPANVPTPVDLLAALAESVHRERQRRIDDQPCPVCGGDRLRTNFTGTGPCHAPRSHA